MVRLKQMRYQWFENKNSCLNSTMVRLKLSFLSLCTEISRKSQFHYGSIKTTRPFFYFYFFYIGLNSTMVRLKLLLNKEQQFRLSIKSQFHYGSIKTNINKI